MFQLFTDVERFASTDNILSAAGHGDPLARWDGDTGLFHGFDITRRVGRCSTYVGYRTHPSHRYDLIQNDRSGEMYISPRTPWVMLNSSYDMIAGVCDMEAFALEDDRYLKRDGKGATTWARDDVFSIHMSCFASKPTSVRHVELEKDLPPCLKEIWDRFYSYLTKHDMEKLLVDIPEQLKLHQQGSSRMIQDQANNM